MFTITNFIVKDSYISKTEENRKENILKIIIDYITRQVNDEKQIDNNYSITS